MTWLLPCSIAVFVVLIIVVWSALIVGARADEANEEWSRHHEPR